MGINRPRNPRIPKGQRQKPPTDQELFESGQIDQEEYEARLAKKARARGAIARTKYGVARGPRKLGGANYRKPGTKMTYDRDQTEQYLSPRARLKRATQIAARWDELVEELPIEDNVTLYLIGSDRATDGYWVVKRKETPNEPLPVPPLPPLPPNQPPTPGGGGGVQEPIYVLNFAGGAGLPPGLTAQSRRIFVNGISYPYLGGETYADPNNGGIVIASSVLAINAPRPETSGNFAGQSLADLTAQGIPYWLISGKIYNLSNGGSLIVIIYEYVGDPPYPAFYDNQSTNVEYQRPTSLADPLVLRGAPDNYGLATPLEGAPGTPGTPQPGLPDPTPLPPVPPVQPDTEPPQVDYECDCPDYSRIELMDPASPFESRFSDRVWIDSQAGCDVETGCKHIMAVKLRRGEPVL